MPNKKRKGPAKAGDAHQAPPFSPDEQTAAHAQNHGAEAATSEAAADLIATTKKKPTGLSPKGRDTRYAADTLTGGGCYLDGQRARKERSPDQAVRAHKKARSAAAASHELEFGVDDSPDGGGEMFELDAESRPTGGGISAGRRTAIFYSFVSIHGSPPESEWDGRGGTVSQICAWLYVTVQSARVVRRCMADIVAAAERGENYDGSHVAPGRGRPAKVIPGSPDAQRIEGMLLTCYGAPQATVLLNLARSQRKDNHVPISVKAVDHFVQNNPRLRCLKRPTKKSGKDDKGSAWALARMAQAKQWLEQLSTAPAGTRSCTSTASLGATNTTRIHASATRASTFGRS